MKSTFMKSLQLALLMCSLPFSTHGTPASSKPVVKLDYGSFQGVEDGGLVKFLGMPFAAPPIGNLRFTPPQPPLAFKGVRKAVAYGLACPQQAPGNASSILGTLNIPPSALRSLHGGGTPIPVSEDCLFINVIKPASVKHDKKLPVVFWIYGGGFEIGDTSFYPGDPVVNRSIVLNEPVIYVSTNYRLNAFGFLGGKEAQAAGAANVGLKDQRFALKWVQKNIALFGGDPKKVTIWGESAGAISSSLHMLINNGNTEGLFRAAFMESGAPFPLNPITDLQPVYDQLVSDTGCQGTHDTFKCLRAVPFDTLMGAVNKSPGIYAYQSLHQAYTPTIDGKFIVRNTAASIQKGLYARIPIISGNLEDEGTLFSFANMNVTTDAEFREYVSTIYLSGTTDNGMDAIMNAYPSDITMGSPFDTGRNNSLTLQFKRLAAFQGDLMFHAPRRFFMQATAKTQPTYGFLYKRDKSTPFLGSFHTHDISEFYGSDTLSDFIGTDALLNFVNNLDPNYPKHNSSLLPSINWPLYNSSATAPPLFTFLDPAPSVSITPDTFRASATQLLTKLSSGL